MNTPNDVSMEDLELAAGLLANTADNGAQIGLSAGATGALTRVAAFLRAQPVVVGAYPFDEALAQVRAAREEIAQQRAIVAELRTVLEMAGIEAPIIPARKPPPS